MGASAAKDPAAQPRKAWNKVSSETVPQRKLGLEGMGGLALTLLVELVEAGAHQMGRKVDGSAAMEIGNRHLAGEELLELLGELGRHGRETARMGG